MSTATTEYSVTRYRSGNRFVVILTQLDEAGAEVVFGPDTEQACRDYIARNPVQA